MLSVINALVGLTRTANDLRRRYQLAQQLQPLWRQLCVYIGHTCDVAAQSSRYRVGTRLEYDGNCCSRRLCRDCIMSQNAMEQGSRGELGRPLDVRFGSKADMCSASGHVR